jgi:hypothetical protein
VVWFLASHILLAAVAGPPSDESILLSLLITEGGINPGEEFLTVASDGSVYLRRWRLASREPVEERWSIGAEGVARLLRAVEEGRFSGFPPQLNDAAGSAAAFTVRLAVRREGVERSVLAYRHGSPEVPQEFDRLVRQLRESVMAVRPTPPPP